MIDDRAAKRALMTWGVGRSFIDGEPASGAAVVMIEDPSHVDEALRTGAVRSGGVALVPEGSTEIGPEIRSMTFAGDPSSPANELSIGDDVFVQLQDYATAEYMSVIGPTLVRVFGTEDFEVLLADLDAAVDEGRFPEYLVHPAAQLADRAALGAPVETDGPRTRLHLRQDGSWGLGPLAAPLGTLGDSFDTLLAAWDDAAGRDVAHQIPLGGAVDPATLDAATSARPWLAHASAAVSARQDLAARGVLEVAISGFGQRLNPVLAEWPTVASSPWRAPLHSTPVLAWSSDAAFLHLPSAGRTFQVGREAALAFEVVLATGDAAEATAFLPTDIVDAALHQLEGAGVALRPAAA